MREIKFRAWDIVDKQWIEADNLYLLASNGHAFTKYGDNLGLWDESLVLMQYTGLKDKNGKEIYEGDILGGDYPDEVYWSKERLQWMLRNGENPDDTLWEIARDNVEIIGNIYENANLLK